MNEHTVATPPAAGAATVAIPLHAALHPTNLYGPVSFAPQRTSRIS